MFKQVVAYFSSALVELKKVVWPDRKTVVRHTMVVAGAVFVTMIIVGLLDFGLSELLQKSILHIK